MAKTPTLHRIARALPSNIVARKSINDENELSKIANLAIKKKLLCCSMHTAISRQKKIYCKRVSMPKHIYSKSSKTKTSYSRSECEPSRRFLIFQLRPIAKRSKTSWHTPTTSNTRSCSSRLSEHTRLSLPMRPQKPSSLFHLPTPISFDSSRLTA